MRRASLSITAKKKKKKIEDEEAAYRAPRQEVLCAPVSIFT